MKVPRPWVRPRSREAYPKNSASGTVAVITAVPAARGGPRDPAAAGREIAEHATDAVLGYGRRDLDDRFQQRHRARPQRLAQREPAGRAERHLRGVLGVGRPVGERDAQPGHRVAAERALGQRVAAARLHGPRVLLRHPTADDRRAELEARPRPAARRRGRHGRTARRRRPV